MTPFVSVRRRRPASLLVNGALVQIFLALILYLVVVFDSDLTPQSVPAGIRLPHVLGSREPLEAIRVEVSREGFTVEGETLALERDGRQRVKKASLQQLTSLLVRTRQLSPTAESLLLVADARLPFAIFEPLIRAAEGAGLTRWALLVDGGSDPGREKGRGNKMIPSVFPQRYSLFSRRKRYLVEFQRGDQKLSSLWDPSKAFPLGTPARFWLHREKGRIRLMDTRTSKGVREIAELRFNAPISLKIHSTDPDPWVITLRKTTPIEPVAFKPPETLDIPIVAPPFYLYSGYRRRLLGLRNVSEKFRIQIGKTLVFQYEYKDGQHLIIPRQEDVTWRTFEGDCQELIKDVAFSLDDTPFLEGWVEWEQHWWRMMPLTPPEGTEMFVVRNQDPGFFTRNTGIVTALLSWLVWLVVPMIATRPPEPADPATLTVQTTPRFNVPLSNAERLRRKRLDDVRVIETESLLPEGSEEEAIIVGSTDTSDRRPPEERVTRIPSRRGRRSFYMGENIELRGDGILAEYTLQKYMERHSDEVQTCHNDLLRKQTGQKGAVIMSWTISPFGKGEKIKFKKTDIADTEFQDCLERLVDRIQFPRPQSGAVDVEYQFYFEGIQ